MADREMTFAVAADELLARLEVLGEFGPEVHLVPYTPNDSFLGLEMEAIWYSEDPDGLVEAIELLPSDKIFKISESKVSVLLLNTCAVRNWLRTLGRRCVDVSCTFSKVEDPPSVTHEVVMSYGTGSVRSLYSIPDDDGAGTYS